MGPPLLWIVRATERNPSELILDVKWLLSQLSPNTADQVHAHPPTVSDKVHQASHAPLEPLYSSLDKGKPSIRSTRAHTCISWDSNGNYCLCCKIVMASICKFSYDLYSDLCLYQVLSFCHLPNCKLLSYKYFWLLSEQQVSHFCWQNIKKFIISTLFIISWSHRKGYFLQTVYIFKIPKMCQHLRCKQDRKL